MPVEFLVLECPSAFIFRVRVGIYSGETADSYIRNKSGQVRPEFFILWNHEESAKGNYVEVTCAGSDYSIVFTGGKGVLDVGVISAPPAFEGLRLGFQNLYCLIKIVARYDYIVQCCFHASGHCGYHPIERGVPVSGQYPAPWVSM